MTRRTARMTPLRRTALVAGVLYLVTFAASIPALGLYDGVLNDPAGFVRGAGDGAPVAWGALLEIILAVAGIGTAVVLYPVLRRWSRALALGFVTARTLEAAMILTGVVSLLSVLTLRQDAANADAASLDTTARALVAVHDWTFLLGPGVMAAVNALCFGTVMYRSGLVPRIIPAVGLIGAPILLASDVATLFGVWDQVSAPALLAVLPVAAWEFSVGAWMTVKGFRRSAVEPAAPAASLQAAAA